MPPVASKPRLTISKIVKHNKLNRYSSNSTSIYFFILKIKASSHRSTKWQFTEKRAHLLGFKLSSEACKPCMRAPRLMPWWSIRPLDQDEQTLTQSGCERPTRSRRGGLWQDRRYRARLRLGSGVLARRQPRQRQRRAQAHRQPPVLPAPVSSTSRLLYEPVPSRAMTEFVMEGIPQEQAKGLKHAYQEIRHPGHHRNLP